MMHKKSIVKFLIVGITIFGTIAVTGGVVFSSILDTLQKHDPADRLNIVVGDLQTVWTKELTRVAVANPAVADVVETNPSEMLVSGKSPGKTDIYIWDKYGKRTVTVWVFAEDLDIAQMRLADLLRSAGLDNVSISKSTLEGKLTLSGEIDESDKGVYESIIAPFSSSVINLVKEKEKRELVEIDVQIAEINTTYTKNLGFEWTDSFTFQETSLPTPVHTFTDIFRIGSMSRTNLIQAKINAAIQEGKGKILSRPKIVAKSGEEASFLVGGQIPVKTTNTSSGGNVQENVDFHDYGVNLKIKPTVKDDGKIDIDLNVDVTDIDSANAVGDDVAYTSRSAQTKLFLDNGQAIILAGFMKDNKGQTVKRVPLLGSFPVFGFLFRNKNVTADNQTELVITLTPRVVVTNEPKKIAPVPVSEKQTSEEKKKTIVSSLAQTEMQYKKPAYQPIAVPGYMADYVRAVQERIARNVIYPKEAKEAKAQGVVELTLSIIKSGALSSASVRKSSGYPVLDDAALETVHRLSPYRTFPLDSTLKEVTVTIPIVYQLD